MRPGRPKPASPCNRICVIDDKSGWCRGCHRTLAEISHWEKYSRAEKFAVLKKIALRKAAAAVEN
ncbi:MAG: DUF1289 domain-containing protein [Betaproteobacteria bacterium]|nr:DUF1289 domain-containing protein [Betaproteobacteria bacterium]